MSRFVRETLLVEQKAEAISFEYTKNLKTYIITLKCVTTSHYFWIPNTIDCSSDKRNTCLHVTQIWPVIFLFCSSAKSICCETFSCGFMQVKKAFRYDKSRSWHDPAASQLRISFGCGLANDGNVVGYIRRWKETLKVTLCKTCKR